MGIGYDAPSSGGGAVSSVAGRTGAVVLAESDITSLTTDLAAKLAKASNLSDLASTALGRYALGLQPQSAFATAMANYTAIGVAVTFTNASSTGIATGTTISSTVTSTGNITSGSNTILSANGSYTVGDGISGTGIPTGARVATISGTTLTITDWAGNALNATATTTGVTLLSPNPAAPWRYTRMEPQPFTTSGNNLMIPLQNWATANGSKRVGAGADSMRLEFDFDGQAFEIVLYQTTAPTQIRVWANETVSADSTAVTATSALGYTKVDFGSRAYRRVVVEIDKGAWLSGIRRAATDTIMPPSMQNPLKFAVVGDSFSVGGGINSSTPNTTSYADTLMRLLGVVHFRNRGVSGTGFLSSDTYRTRISDVTSTFWQPDVILVQGSTNDSASSQGSITTEVTTYLNALTAALPNAKVYVTGVMRPLTATAGDLTNNAGIKAGCLAASPAVTFIDPQTGPEGAWFYGTGKVGTTTGDGNADFYQSSVTSAHPSPAAHGFIARSIASHLAPQVGVRL